MFTLVKVLWSYGLLFGGFEEIGDFIAIEGQETNEDEVVVDWEPIVFAEKIEDCFGLKALCVGLILNNIYLYTHGEVVEADGFEQVFHRHEHFPLFIDASEDIEYLLRRRKTPYFVFVASSQEHIDRRLGRRKYFLVLNQKIGSGSQKHRLLKHIYKLN